MDDFAKEYALFRNNIPQKKITVSQHLTWTIYDSGPRSVKCPLIFFPPSIGKADSYFNQMISLSSFGYRVISVDYPVLWTISSFCSSFFLLLDTLNLSSVHIFGAGLGGFLAQKFAEYVISSKRVISLILCNSYSDTIIFDRTMIAKSYWALPSLLLKQKYKDYLETNSTDRKTFNTIRFMNISLDELKQSELSSRLTLEHLEDYVRPHQLIGLPIMLIHSLDDTFLPSTNYEEMCKCYPEARKAELKNGGHFPYLSRAEEINIFLKVHLQQFMNTRYSALDPKSEMLQLCG